MTESEPDYSKCTLRELLETRRLIDEHSYPERTEKLDLQIRDREAAERGHREAAQSRFDRLKAEAKTRQFAYKRLGLRAIEKKALEWCFFTEYREGSAKYAADLHRRMPHSIQDFVERLSSHSSDESVRQWLEGNVFPDDNFERFREDLKWLSEEHRDWKNRLGYGRDGWIFLLLFFLVWIALDLILTR